MDHAGKLENAINTYRHAWTEAQAAAAEIDRSLEMAALLKNKTDQDLFIRKAKRAIVAADNWRGSMELALGVIEEITTGVPRPRRAL